MVVTPLPTRVASLGFEDRPFEAGKAGRPCALCDARDSFPDKVIVDDAGARRFVWSDTDHCDARQADGHRGQDAA